MEVDREQFKSMIRKAEQESQNMTNEQLMDKAEEYYLKACREVIISGYHLASALKLDGAVRFASQLKGMGENELVAHALINVYGRAQLISATIRNPSEIVRQVSRSAEYESYSSLSHRDIMNAGEKH